MLMPHPRILISSTEFPPGPGGIGTHCQQLALGLTRLGWKVQVHSPQDYATEQEIDSFNSQQPFEVKRVKRVSNQIRWIYRRWISSAVVAQAMRPDLILASGERAVWLTAHHSPSLGTPWVAIGHGSEFRMGSPWEQRLTRWSFRRATGVVCVSQFTWDLMIGSGIHPRSGRVIPNGADDSLFRLLPRDEVAAFRANLGLNADHLLLTLGNVTDRKGQEIVIRALPQVLSQLPETHYLMIGLPTVRERLTALARDLGVSDHVHFLGRVPNQDLLRYLNACDLFVMTSRRTPSGDCEGYGIAVVEAALCGTPAVVSRDCGLAEAIVDGRTGIAVPEDDPEQTAVAILSILRDRSLNDRMGSAARHRAMNEQTWTLRASAYDEYLRSLIAQPAIVPVSV